MAQPDLGSTFETDPVTGDLAPRMRLLTTPADKASGWVAALAARLLQPYGTLWYAPNYGYGLTELVADDEEPAVAAELVNQCFSQDGRVHRCETTIATGGDRQEEWTISSNVKALDGAVFDVVFKVTKDSASVFSITQGQG